MSNFWIPVHQELLHHPKTKKMSRLLKISTPATIGHLVYLWHWAVNYAPDGNLNKYDAYDISEGSEWEGDPVEFLNSLISSRFIVEINNQLHINDWNEYAGKFIKKAEKEADRKRKKREEWKMSAGCPQDVHRTDTESPQHGDCKIREDKIREDLSTCRNLKKICNEIETSSNEIENKRKNIKKENFEKHWSNYPNKKGSKEKSYKSYIKFLKQGFTDEQIGYAVEEYNREVIRKNTDKDFMIYASTFFNGRFQEFLKPEEEKKEIIPVKKPDWMIKAEKDEEIAKKRLLEKLKKNKSPFTVNNLENGFYPAEHKNDLFLTEGVN